MLSHPLVSGVTLYNAGYRVVFEEWGICVTVTYRGKIVIEGKKCTKIGLWIVPIKNQANASKEAHFMHETDPNDTYVGVNKQVNDDMKAHSGASNLYMTNVIQTSSKGELANYHPQSLGSPTIWLMLNALKNYPTDLMSMPDMDKDLITKYVEPSTATAKGHMVRGRKNIRSTHSN